MNRRERALSLWLRAGSERAASATPAQYLEAMFGRWSDIGYTQPLLERTVRGDLAALGADAKAGIGAPRRDRPVCGGI